ncbi:MAG: PilZ domain-containing protein [Proteobacteria bacterium]|nr:PilZ domain-containing protein [Pseudomonadota bacterium]MBU4469128.1 PilZ domain-containing protein [Pseudomonadota bacterium]MCG2752160.1 PilZ domain-containing protein [Desulfobacteraceae bacterium]
MKEDIEEKTGIRERRHHPRFPAMDRALVAVAGDEFSLPYHLMDISQGGMAFRYLNKSPMDLTGNRMDLYLEKDLHVGRLPVTVKADLPLPGDVIPRRRCSVAFGEMTPAQEIQLQAFIGLHA